MIEAYMVLLRYPLMYKTKCWMCVSMFLSSLEDLPLLKYHHYT
jgi:hypothetical protein